MNQTDGSPILLSGRKELELQLCIIENGGMQNHIWNCRSGIGSQVSPDCCYDAAAVELASDEPTTRPVAESWDMSRAYIRRTFEW